ncbi:hypothetical protein L207DRAFT_81257 [Hyaloscypha variabilis F]|uniref:Uncharacterized protein n=1 Tax=Hyaloscypha variabilis (strain UAMH 11265 / GT02V1 / F) TaxID=1149755 RepID=A0A2J6RH21_HYAVF|nr:hypothetical protein L207DRAFT_81257 [Hyaloscypha variabilis F]
MIQQSTEQRQEAPATPRGCHLRLCHPRLTGWRSALQTKLLDLRRLGMRLFPCHWLVAEKSVPAERMIPPAQATTHHYDLPLNGFLSSIARQPHSEHSHRSTQTVTFQSLNPIHTLSLPLYCKPSNTLGYTHPWQLTHFLSDWPPILSDRLHRIGPP